MRDIKSERLVRQHTNTSSEIVLFGVWLVQTANERMNENGRQKKSRQSEKFVLSFITVARYNSKHKIAFPRFRLETFKQTKCARRISQGPIHTIKIFAGVVAACSGRLVERLVANRNEICGVDKWNRMDILHWFAIKMLICRRAKSHNKQLIGIRHTSAIPVYRLCDFKILRSFWLIFLSHDELACVYCFLVPQNSFRYLQKKWIDVDDAMTTV